MAKKNITPEQQLAEIEKYINSQLKELATLRRRKKGYVKLASGDPNMLAGLAIEFATINGNIATLNDLAYKLKINK